MAATPGNAMNLTSAAGLVLWDGTSSMTASAPTNHAIMVGTGSNSITSVGPGSTGQVLQANSSADPTFSTATFPSTATSTGTILRADGTNWSATTSTYPNTNAVSTLLYASSANVMSALATANSGVLATNSTGVPSIDTTNFAVLSTGLQLKGNNTNTAPPAGFIGEQIRSYLASGSAKSMSTGVAQTIASITLTAGIWDISAVLYYASAATTTVNQQVCSISTTNNALSGNNGDDLVQWTIQSGTLVGLTSPLCIPALRVTINSSTTYYMVGQAGFGVSTMTGYGRISAVRVG
jgi:hypothetical protein